MDTRRRSSHLWFGLVLIALGAAFLLTNLGYAAWFNWDRWWPVLLIAIGILMLRRPASSAAPAVPDVSGQPGSPPEGTPSTPVARRFPMAAVILIGVGVAFLLDDIIGGSAFPAIVLITIGVGILLRDRWER